VKNRQKLADKAAKAKVDVAAQAEEFKKLRSRAKAREFLKDMPRRDLVALAAEVPMPHGKNDNAQQIRDALVRYAGAGEDHDVIMGQRYDRRGAVSRAAAPKPRGKMQEAEAEAAKVLEQSAVRAPRKETPAAVKKAVAEAKPQSQAPLDVNKKAEGRLRENGWGGMVRDGEHYFHPDGEIPSAMRAMGEDGKIDVEGERLDNRLGDIATLVVLGDITPQQGLDEYKKLRDRLPKGSRPYFALDSAIKQMDVPKRERPASYKGAPKPLQDLMDALLENPLARGNPAATRGRGKDHKSEVDKLDEIMQAWHKGELSQRRAQRLVQGELFNKHHESQEGKVPLDRVVVDALKDIEKMDKDAWEAGEMPSAPEGTSAKRIRAAHSAEKLKMRRADRDRRVQEMEEQVQELERQMRFQERELKDPDNAWVADSLRQRLAQMEHEAQMVQAQIDKLKAIPDDKLGAARKRESLDPAAEKLERKFSSGEKDAKRHRIHAGAQGRKERLTLPDGSIVFSKQLDPRGLSPHHNGVAEADSEELASLLGRAFGAPVPVVARADDTHILMDWVDGKTFGEVLPHERQKAEADPGYKLMGLLDMLTYNIDRHRGNMMVADGKPVAIDNGLAWSRLGRDPGMSAKRMVQRMLADPPMGPADAWRMFGLHADEAQKLRGKLEALRPQFAARGREGWLDFALEVVSELEKRPDKKRLPR
jgi:hypothetical protein